MYVEDYYNNFYRELSRLDEKSSSFDKIRAFIPELRGDEKIVDIGCGHGGVSYQLVKNGFVIYGIEINDDALESLEKKGFKTIKRNITEPFEIEIKFDVALILDVLEHVIDPLFLLKETKKILNPAGCIIITVPLYFDLLDRLKILFTGSVISLDNLCYGKENYKKFRSFNYDHIRFFRPKDIIELGESLALKIEQIEYVPTSYYGKSRIIKLIVKTLNNRFTAKMFPKLCAHSMKVRWRK
jgi:2-polyprenyl-3-methyl-5-hydroxy-6-metoxy-1,4-benzoquinol methylase